MNITTDNTFEEIEKAIRDIPYPSRPQKPSIATLGKADFRAHADALEAYEREDEAYKEARSVYNAENARLQGIWQAKLREQYNHLNDATFLALVYEKAYDRGHADGCGEVRNFMEDFNFLALKIINANK